MSRSPATELLIVSMPNISVAKPSSAMPVSRLRSFFLQNI